MAATLKFEKRDGTRQERGAAAARERAHPGRALRRREGQGVRDRRRSEALLQILHSESGVNTLIGLEGVADAARDTRVLVKEYQLDPIDHKLLHADFYQVAMDKMLTVTVPIVLKGEAKGVKQQGGIVDFVNREIEIEVLPGDIPEHITVDVTELMLNQGVRVRDLHTEGAKWKPISDADMMIVHVVAPKAEEEAPAAEAAAAAAGAAAEPEVIKKGKPERTKRRAGSRADSSAPSERERWAASSRMKLVVGLGNPVGSTRGPGTTSASRSSMRWPRGMASSGRRRRPRRSSRSGEAPARSSSSR